MESLEDVKVGDNVILFDGWNKSIVTVTKVTKTQIHIGYGKYRKCDGRLVGAGAWDISRITLYTEEKENEINIEKKRRRMLAYFKSYKFNLLGYEEMVKVYNMLKEIEK